jgi:hypothetical protein
MKRSNLPSREPGFAERLQTAVKAKQAQLKKILGTARGSDAQSAERHASRVDTAEARKIRAAEHKKSNRVDAQLRGATRAAEKARQSQAVTQEKARKDAERVALVEADAALKHDQKAARDLKYAARKARQK